jgi:hypothetical protein
VWLEEPPAIEPERNTLLLKIYFGDLLEPAVLIAHVRKFSADATALKRRLEAAAPDDSDPFGDLTLRHGLEWARAMIRWATGAEKEIEARLAAPLR